MSSAKNICLAGVKSLTLYDPAPVELADLGTQFFLKESDVGQPRDQSSSQPLAELNRYVPVNVYKGQLDEAAISKFQVCVIFALSSAGSFFNIQLIICLQVVVLTDATLDKQLEINAMTRAKGTHFISANTAGVFSSVFCDFGEKFVCVDPNGEQALQGMVVDIDQDKEATVTALDESRHGLEDGDYVTFSEVEGMTELNGCEPRKVTVKGELRLLD